MRSFTRTPTAISGSASPIFPAASRRGRTLDEAKALAPEPLTGHIGVMREAGDPGSAGTNTLVANYVRIIAARKNPTDFCRKEDKS